MLVKCHIDMSRTIYKTTFVSPPSTHCDQVTMLPVDLTHRDLITDHCQSCVLEKYLINALVAFITIYALLQIIAQ